MKQGVCNKSQIKTFERILYLTCLTEKNGNVIQNVPKI